MAYFFWPPCIDTAWMALKPILKTFYYWLVIVTVLFKRPHLFRNIAAFMPLIFSLFTSLGVVFLFFHVTADLIILHISNMRHCASLSKTTECAAFPSTRYLKLAYASTILIFSDEVNIVWQLLTTVIRSRLKKFIYCGCIGQLQIAGAWKRSAFCCLRKTGACCWYAEWSDQL